MSRHRNALVPGAQVPYDAFTYARMGRVRTKLEVPEVEGDDWEEAVLGMVVQLLGIAMDLQRWVTAVKAGE